MTVQALIFDRTGRNPIEIDPKWDHVSWRLNKIGEARFFLSYSDPKCTPDNLRFGNRVLIRFDNGLPPFGGVIDVPRQQNPDGVSVNVYEAGRILAWRRTAKTVAFSSAAPGTIFQTLIDQANAIWPTGIVPGALYTGGTPRTETYHLDEILQQVLQLQRLTGHDWETVPVYQGGRLTFTANWSAALGADKTSTVLLAEGLNLESVTIDEQGPIANRVLCPGGGAGGTTWDDRLIGTAQDLGSQNLYDLREYAEIQSGTFDQVTLDASAGGILASMSSPRKRFSAQATDRQPAPFSTYALGDRVILQAFLNHPTWAFDGAVHILGMEWTAADLCRLELLEW